MPDLEDLAGTSGFAYPAWKGAFYPEDLPDDRMLAAYAERLPAVEINNTFYRLPTPKRIAAWAAEVPEGFRFVIKASRKITHFKKLVGTEDETGFLVSTVGGLGERLGAVLFQLPPSLKADPDRLAAFLELLPAGFPAAFELRHPSWHGAEHGGAVAELLRGRDLALVVSETDDAPAEGPLPDTAAWGYLRLRRTGYSDAHLAAWADRLRATAWRRALVFFKHEDEAAGPRMARRFLEQF